MIKRFKCKLIIREIGGEGDAAWTERTVQAIDSLSALRTLIDAAETMQPKAEETANGH